MQLCYKQKILYHYTLILQKSETTLVIVTQFFSKIILNRKCYYLSDH